MQPLRGGCRDDDSTNAATFHHRGDTPGGSLAGGGVLHEVRAVLVVWQRGMIRMWGDKGRMVSSLLQPVLFLFVLGAGLSSVVSHGSGGADYKTFIFPGYSHRHPVHGCLLCNFDRVGS